MDAVPAPGDASSAVERSVEPEFGMQPTQASPARSANANLNLKDFMSTNGKLKRRTFK
jgi:hypothetical protein